MAKLFEQFDFQKNPTRKFIRNGDKVHVTFEPWEGDGVVESSRRGMSEKIYNVQMLSGPHKGQIGFFHKKSLVVLD